ncbi:Efflux pump membrane transporter BepE [compost metagenome]
MKYTIMVDVNENLDASIEKVIHTLVEAFILVFIVVFIFLQDFRSTLIPAIAVPVAIVGTFFFLNLFGFTINLLTLFAMVLAIGIVVDDAIVVVEAVHAKLDHGYKSAKKATIHAMDEISGAIISITLVMAAVFIPVTFINGSTGVFYKQFGITLAVAIILSAVNALTLSPALCALLLKPHADDHKHKSYLQRFYTSFNYKQFGITLAVAIILSAVNALTLSPALCALLLKPHADDHKHKSYLQRFYTSFNVAFDNVTARYKRSVSFLSAKKWIALASIVIAGIALVYMMKTTPSAFVPSEDQGTVFANISLPPSASMERSDIIAKRVDSIAKTIPGVKNTLRIVGQNFTAGAGSAYSMVIVKLYPWDQRDLSVDDVIGQLFAKTSGIREASIFFISPPTIQGFGQSGGFEFQLQDKGGHTTSEFYKVNNEFLAKLSERPEIQYATTPFNPGFPQYMMDINLAKAKDAGVSVNTILSTMQGYYGGLYASNFNKFGKQYRVMVQAAPEFRANTEGLNKIFVRNSAGNMAPITEFVKMTRVFGPESISRFNLFTSISITGAPKPGYSSGDAIKAIQEVAAENLPAGYGYEFSGLTREELASGSETIFIFLLCLVFVYFLLSAQYESYILPFAVLLSIPFGLAGAYLFSIIFKLNSNIYLQISLIMLIGLLAKNGILIVEFALDRRRKGLPIVQAAIEGAVARLRPILMTSFAFILGLVPLMFAKGAGAVGNKSIGTGAVGGMLIGTILGVFVIPVLFIIFQNLQERISGPAKDGYDDDDDDEDDIHLIEAHKA